MTETPNTKVYVGFPIADRKIDFELNCTTIRMVQNPCGCDMAWDHRGGKPVENVRNQFVKNAIQWGADYLLMIDADNPPHGNPLELVKFDKDIMVLPTPMFLMQRYYKGMGHDPIAFNTYEDSPVPDKKNKYVWRHHENKHGLQEIDAGGSGAILIARRVLERVRPAFECLWDEWGIKEVGSDLYFCAKAQEAGFEVWTHYDYPCSHWKPTDLLQVYNVMSMRDIRHVNRANVNTREYWDKEWEKRQARDMPQYPMIVKRVRALADEAHSADVALNVPDRPYRVLDYGCGRGDLLAMLAEIPWVDARGVDISEKAVSICRERGLQAYQIGAIEQRPFDHESPDLIVSTEVLEHVPNDRALISEWLEDARRIIYTVPNNCLPPGLEKEHLRVYWPEYCRQITPHLQSISYCGDFLIVEAAREETTVGQMGGSELETTARGDYRPMGRADDNSPPESELYPWAPELKPDSVHPGAAENSD